MTERCDVYFLGFTKIMLGSEPTEKALHEDSDDYDAFWSQTGDITATFSGTPSASAGMSKKETERPTGR